MGVRAASIQELKQSLIKAVPDWDVRMAEAGPLGAVFTIASSAHPTIAVVLICVPYTKSRGIYRPISQLSASGRTEGERVALCELIQQIANWDNVDLGQYEQVE